MNNTIKNVARDLTPPILWRALRSLGAPPPAPVAPPPPEAPAKQYGHGGDYASFAAAQAACGDSYSNPRVLEKTAELTAAITPGVLISQLNLRLLAALQHVAMHTPGPLEVLDFGGAMGAHYFYLKPYLPPIASWTVAEIEETVAAGNQRFADGTLRFTTRIDDCRPNVVLSSGAIQFTPDPYAALASLVGIGTRFLVLDKVPLMERDRITVHHIHPSLFGADVAFVSQFMSDTRVRACLAPYRIVFEWELPGYPAHLDGGYAEVYRGFLLERA